ncbi:MAG: phosphate ABC transporter ATP-binding protein [Omnitrophica WOR_2 bacterium GWF2_43_52]|nr:MAG: phosphate ABC transporter ATP-binding protein [Omnitrophica WOR_2 bacterium GWA2_44_7]OGX20737.1 MAG: phosphate ABC transporter ATP-binding protein [Omnitrophica WOR_2 bacterium GWF2_43_52]OGX55280.1 MAG: phosphate ABC transporter ATP-binding protein [Omnitrophica WOR_2 bacterium RIFOXYC2_FULL_43_9]HAH19758.1 phosphate ABC transporter ATP-binding protein [Candidatus Omnitrophota bacterium]HBG63383.1 phosphate ABC transporter ATP-binding protein [Candidatus Omnitrophota bacterium]
MVTHATRSPGHQVTSKIIIQQLSIWFGKVLALRSLNLEIQGNEILGVIGPANSGKTSFLRQLNRLNELEASFRMSGEVILDNKNIQHIKPEALRKRVGMIFALPQVLPISIYDNVAYGVRMHDGKSKSELDGIVEDSLKSSFLWDEVKDRLKELATKLSGGQQQRLCISRTLAVKPEVVLFDEPCSGLDPISTAKVEESMLKLKEKYTIVLVTNNTKQAARVSDRTAFFLTGELVEIDKTHKLFTAPKDKRTEEYIQGKFG